MVFRALLITTLAAQMVMARPSLAAHPATQVIENLHGTLLAVMQEAGKLGYRGRYQRLAPVISASFDLPFIARVAVGSYWPKFNDSQRSKFIQTFTTLSIATYAANFDGYSGERFKVISGSELRAGQFLVRSVLVKSDGEEVQLDYVLHQKDNTWRIINVIADGVSDLSMKRADYSAFLEKQGFGALLAKLNEKIDQYSQ
jgi:phospholipid transport system substrate-binding protein